MWQAELFRNGHSVNDHLLKRRFEEAEQDQVVCHAPARSLVSINGASLARDPGFGCRNITVGPLKIEARVGHWPVMPDERNGKAPPACLTAGASRRACR
jgi:hypothetical protein